MRRAPLAAFALGLALAAGGVSAQSAQSAKQAPAQPSVQTPSYPGVGRPATAKEVAAWDIDVRPDFKGLPKGSGSVAKGQDVWEAKCASCHGIFGESNEVFSPIVGGTTAQDIKTGRVARLLDPSFPGRTTLMKLPAVSTLWDYINRAMPWNQPKSLSVEEVYAVTAFILNLGGIVPDDFTLSDANIREVQERLPNRNGMTTDHAMWPGAGIGKRKPDVAAVACMTDCATEAKVASLLPDHARNAHGNLAEQNRGVGAQRGADTSRPAPATLAEAASRAAAPAAVAVVAAAPAAVKAGAEGLALAQKNGCTACHGLDNKLVGPGFVEIAKKQGARADAIEYLTGKIRNGGSGVWGAIPMPPQSLGEADAKTIAQWLAAGAPKQ
jgi:cytochrome c